MPFAFVNFNQGPQSTTSVAQGGERLDIATLHRQDRRARANRQARSAKYREMDVIVDHELKSHRTGKPTNRLFRKGLVLLSALIAFAGPGIAQTANTVTLKYDDGDGITGELIEATDDVAKLKTAIGLITVPLDGVFCIGLACPESKRFVSTLPPLVLTALDGSVAVSGNLLEVADGQYVIATDLGELRIDVDKVRCEGEGCPAQADEPQTGGDVVLTSGATSIEGKLVGFEETAYIIEVATMGTIRVNSELFTCSGASCP